MEAEDAAYNSISLTWMQWTTCGLDTGQCAGRALKQLVKKVGVTNLFHTFVFHGFLPITGSFVSTWCRDSIFRRHGRIEDDCGSQRQLEHFDNKLKRISRLSTAGKHR